MSCSLHAKDNMLQLVCKQWLLPVPLDPIHDMLFYLGAMKTSIHCPICVMPVQMINFADMTNSNKTIDQYKEIYKKKCTYFLCENTLPDVVFILYGRHHG